MFITLSNDADREINIVTYSIFRPQFHVVLAPQKHHFYLHDNMAIIKYGRCGQMLPYLPVQQYHYLGLVVAELESKTLSLHTAL